MAESRREKPRFLRLSVFCIGSAANAAITGSLVRGIAGPSVSGQCRPLVFGALSALGFEALPALGFEALPAPWIGALPAPWFRGDADPLVSRRCRLLGFGAFILTASKSKINDETPSNSCSLRGRSSLFRDIAVFG